jgi:hypothetical protein
MPIITDTAYPRLTTSPSATELEEAFSPSPTELAFAVRRTRRPAPRLALLVLLKTFQRLGYFVQIADVSALIVTQIAGVAGLTSAVSELDDYDDTTYRTRLTSLVRGFLNVTGYDPLARGIVVRASIGAARTRDDLADIVNVAIEELVRHRYELPAFGTLLKIARTARSLVAATTARSPQPCRQRCGSVWPPRSWFPKRPRTPIGTGPRRSRCGRARSVWGSSLPTSTG